MLGGDWGSDPLTKISIFAYKEMVWNVVLDPLVFSLDEGIFDQNKSENIFFALDWILNYSGQSSPGYTDLMYFRPSP